MKISKKTLLIMGGVFSVFSLGLMFVSAAERNLSKDLNNAVQHIETVAFVSTGTNNEATMGSTEDELIGIETKHFIIGETNNLTGKYSSSILGGIRNEIYGSNDVILAGSGNKVKGTNNSILGGEGNSVVGQGNGSYNVIIGGKNNKLEGNNSVDYSVILGGISNLISSGKSSVVMGTHSSVNGSHSVALGSGSKVEANNSFLWTDGSNSDTLNSDNVFAIIAQSGAVINTDKAHSFAKLTLGGPMIVFSGRTGENITCEGGVGGGILKVVQSDNNQMCMCSCDGTGWNSMFGKGRCRSVCDVSLVPECGETVAKVAKSVGGREYAAYSGSCKKGVVVEGTGAYLVTKDNKVHWSCQTEDGLVVGCSGSVEGGYLSINWCKGVEPSGMGVIKGSPTYLGNGVKNWEGNDNLNVLGPCQWKCGTGYEIDYVNGLVNGKPTRCKVKVVEKDCTGTPPTNADWVNNKFTQTWNGSEWTPGNVEISYWDGNNTKPCSYKCNTGYDWNGTSCVKETYQCTGPEPSYAEFITGSADGLTENTPRKLYAYGDTDGKKCAYRCNHSNGFYYYNEQCVEISNPCLSSVYGCTSPSTGTNKNEYSSGYTWDCKADGEIVNQKKCVLCKTGYHPNNDRICVENECRSTMSRSHQLPAEDQTRYKFIKMNGNYDPSFVGYDQWDYVEPEDWNIAVSDNDKGVCIWTCADGYVINSDYTECVLNNRPICNIGNKSNIRSKQKFCNVGTESGVELRWEYAGHEAYPYWQYYCISDGRQPEPCSKYPEFVLVFAPRVNGACNSHDGQCYLTDNIQTFGVDSSRLSDILSGVQYLFNSKGDCVYMPGKSKPRGAVNSSSHNLQKFFGENYSFINMYSSFGSDLEVCGRNTSNLPSGWTKSELDYLVMPDSDGGDIGVIISRES